MTPERISEIAERLRGVAEYLDANDEMLRLILPLYAAAYPDRAKECDGVLGVVSSDEMQTDLREFADELALWGVPL